MDWGDDRKKKSAPLQIPVDRLVSTLVHGGVCGQSFRRNVWRSTSSSSLLIVWLSRDSFVSGELSNDTQVNCQMTPCDRQWVTTSQDVGHYLACGSSSPRNRSYPMRKNDSAHLEPIMYRAMWEQISLPLVVDFWSQRSRVDVSVGGEETTESGDQGDSHSRVRGRTVRSVHLRQNFRQRFLLLLNCCLFSSNKKRRESGEENVTVKLWWPIDEQKNLWSSKMNTHRAQLFY